MPIAKIPLKIKIQSIEQLKETCDTVIDTIPSDFSLIFTKCNYMKNQRQRETKKKSRCIEKKKKVLSFFCQEKVILIRWIITL